MQQYPSIPGSKIAFQYLGKPIIAQYKYDGSSLRWEWSPKKGWHKFGTRHQLFDHTTLIYNEAIPLFLNGPAETIKDMILSMDKKCQRITAFTEFFGEGSFAGSHIDGEEKQLKLLDIFVFKKGFIPVKKFMNIFCDFKWCPEIIYEGELTSEFIEDVRAGKYPVEEGVVCKGEDFMVKIKTRAYLEKLKGIYADSWENYAE
jgi:hypothetical protein